MVVTGWEKRPGDCTLSVVFKRLDELMRHGEVVRKVQINAPAWSDQQPGSMQVWLLPLKVLTLLMLPMCSPNQLCMTSARVLCIVLAIQLGVSCVSYRGRPAGKAYLCLLRDQHLPIMRPALAFHAQLVLLSLLFAQLAHLANCTAHALPTCAHHPAHRLSLIMTAPSACSHGKHMHCLRQMLCAVQVGRVKQLFNFINQQ